MTDETERYSGQNIPGKDEERISSEYPSAEQKAVSPLTPADHPNPQPAAAPEPPAAAPSYQPVSAPEPPAAAPSYKPVAAPEPPAAAPSYKPVSAPEPPAVAPSYKPMSAPEPPAVAPSYKPMSAPEPSAAVSGTPVASYPPHQNIAGPGTPMNYPPRQNMTVPGTPMNYPPRQNTAAPGTPMTYHSGQNNVLPVPPYQNSYVDQSFVPDLSKLKKPKKDGWLKFTIWMTSALLVIAAVFIVLKVIGVNNGDQKERKGNDNIPYNGSSEVSYGGDVSMQDAPDVSADPNGPQISTVEETKEEPEGNAANEAFRKASPSVVCITSYKTGRDITLSQLGEGSGIVLSEDGYIATNSHVVSNSTSTGVMITMTDGSQYLGTIIGVDQKTDLAVLKIDAKGLTVAEFADSDQLYVGQDVYAIGNPGGSAFSNSMTKGTVSAVNRILSTNGYVKYIQTDAAINPGNSGGALINSEGQVIGMNTSKLVATDYEGMSFAIPSNKVAEIINKLIKYGYINDRGTLSITGITCSLYESKLKNVPQGMVITKINSDSPLFTTAAQEQDIITAINGKTIKTSYEFIDELSQFKPGDSVKLTLFRAASGSSKSSVTFDVEVVLIEDSQS